MTASGVHGDLHSWSSAENTGTRSLHVPARSLELLRSCDSRLESGRTGTCQRQRTLHPAVFPSGKTFDRYVRQKCYFINCLYPCLVSSVDLVVRSIIIVRMYTVFQKTVQNCFCQNFVKFPPIFKIVDRKMVKRLKLCVVHSFFTAPRPNSRHHITVLNANVRNYYTTL